MKKLKEYIELYFLFFKIGLFTFGGGLAMLPLIANEVVDKRSWITDQDMLDIVAISESTPGPISINTATFVGFKRHKVLGGILATLGVISPSIIIISIIAGFYDQLIQIEIIQKALKGIIGAVVVMIAFSILKLSKGLKGSGVKLINWIFILVTLVLKVVCNVSPIFLIIIGGAIGALLYTFILKEKQQ